MGGIELPPHQKSFPHFGTGGGGFHGNGKIFRGVEQEPGHASGGEARGEPAHGFGFAKDSGSVGAPFFGDAQFAQRLLHDETEMRTFRQNHDVGNAAAQFGEAQIRRGEAPGCQPGRECIDSEFGQSSMLTLCHSLSRDAIKE